MRARKEYSNAKIALTASGAAVFGSCLAVSFSTPALTRPVPAALLFLVAAPAALAALASLSLGWLPGLQRYPGARVTTASCLASLPWLAVAAAPMARTPLAVLLAAALQIVAALLVVNRGWRTLGVLWIVALALPVWPRLPVLELDGERPLIILGFDGATWEQIDALIEAGELPHFRALKQVGAAGILHSEPDSASPRVWTTIATGVSPKVHGISGFGINRSALRAGRIWDEVTAHGGTAGIVGWLLNWPPDPSLSFSVPGWLATGTLAVPPKAGFVKRMEHAMEEGGDPFDSADGASPAAGSRRPAEHGESEGRHRFSPSLIADGLSALAVSSADNAWRLLWDLVKLRLQRPSEVDLEWRLRLLRSRLQTDLYLELLDRYRPQFSALVTYPTDSLGHKYWKYHEPDLYPSVTPEEVSLRGHVVREAYRTADRTIGKLLARIDLSHTTLILTSDHGMEGAAPNESTIRIRESALLRILGMEEELNATTVPPLYRTMITPRMEGAAGDSALSRARRLLGSAINENQPDPPFEVSTPEGFPRVLVVRLMRKSMEASDTIRIGDQRTTVAELFMSAATAGTHTTRGIILVAGPGVRHGTAIAAAQVDVAPTALYAMGESVPEALEGRVLKEAYTPEWGQTHAPRSRLGAMAPPGEPGEAPVDQDLVRRRLRALGYVQ